MRRGDTVEGHESLEILTSGESGYVERQLVFLFRCTEPAFHGFFDPISGAAEPPSGPELELVDTGYVEEGEHGDKIIWLSPPETEWLERFLGTDLYETAYNKAYERASEQ